MDELREKEGGGRKTWKGWMEGVGKGFERNE